MLDRILDYWILGTDIVGLPDYTLTEADIKISYFTRVKFHLYLVLYSPLHSHWLRIIEALL